MTSLKFYKEYYLLRRCLGDLKVWQIQLILEPLGNGGPGGGRRSMGKGDGLHPGWSGWNGASGSFWETRIELLGAKCEGWKLAEEPG